MGEPTKVPADAADNLRIGICQGLLRWVTANAERWTRGHDLEAADLILVTIFARSTRTYEGIVRCLGESGFGEQAQMLNRSLFEDMVDAHWVSLNRDLAVKRLEQHDLYSRLLRADTQRKFPAYYDSPPPRIKVSNEERSSLKALFGKAGSRSWTGVAPLDGRVEAVMSCWKSEEQRTLLRWWAAWVHKTSNEVLHLSSFSIGRIGSPNVNDTGALEWHFGSSRGFLAHALTGAFFTISQYVGLMIDEFAPDVAPALAEMIQGAETAFSKADEWDETGLLERP